jgi:short-subunit dehydrogenase
MLVVASDNSTWRMIFLEVKDRVCIVTGASSGIGLATARLLASKGAYVVLVSRSKERLRRLAEEIPNSMAVPADITRAFEIKRMVKEVAEHFDRIDVLVNNAGVGYDAFVEKIDMDTWHYVFDLDLAGPVTAMQQVIPYMRKQGGGAIVNVSSAVALMVLPDNGPYAAIKRGLATVSLIAREELKKDNITVGVAYPYITLTNFEKNTIRDVPVPEGEEEPHGPFPPDSAEFAAQKIVEGIESGEAEIFAHEWMRQRMGGNQQQS